MPGKNDLQPVELLNDINVKDMMKTVIYFAERTQKAKTPLEILKIELEAVEYFEKLNVEISED